MKKNQKIKKGKQKKMSGSNLVFRGLVSDLAVILSKSKRMSKKKIIELMDAYLCELKLMNKRFMIRDLDQLYKAGTRIANT